MPAVKPGAITARNIVRGSAERGLKLRYPLFVAGAYAGHIMWHMGYSSSAALFVTTPGNAMESMIDRSISATETIFTGWNRFTTTSRCCNAGASLFRGSFCISLQERRCPLRCGPFYFSYGGS